MNKINTLEQDPILMYASIQETDYRVELELLNKFLTFSAELLRLSLLGIAVVGYVYTKIIIPSKQIDPSLFTKVLFISGIVSFTASAGTALRHRYIATDAFRHFVFGLRLHKRVSDQETEKEKYRDFNSESIKELIERYDCLESGPWLKKMSSYFLFGGAFFIMIAFVSIIIENN